MTSGEAGTAPGEASEGSAAVDRLLDRAVVAMNRGDVAEAHQLAATALAGDTTNREAAALLAESAPAGELRRATLLFADLVGSTALSERHEPELYRTVVRRYTSLCRDVIEARYGGHVSHVAGDGLLAVFGVPTPHENDVERAVRAALDIADELAVLSAEVEAAVGERLRARAGVHKGLVYLDTVEDEIYGLAANVASRLHGLAAPGEVLVSDAVLELVGDLVHVEPLPPQQVKGVSEPLAPYRVVGLAAAERSGRRRPEGPFVGRRPQQEAVLAVWGAVAAGGGPQGVHLVGEAGIGKSRLCAAALDAARPQPAVVVDLCGSPFHTEAGFHPLRVLLDERSRLVAGAARAGLPEVVAAVGLEPDDLVPLLAPVSDLPSGPHLATALDGRKLREAIADAGFRFLAAVLTPGPSVLVVEDLHWCDGSTVGIVARLLAEGPDGLLVLSSSRSPAPPELRGAVEVALGPLSAEESAELVAALAPGITAEESRAVVGRADGVPFFLEELIHGRTAAAAAPGAPRAAGAVGAAATVPPAGPSGGEVPAPLYELLVSRLYATPGAARAAGAAAAIGRRVDHAMVARVAGLPAAELDAALDGLVDAHVLVADDDGLRFRHELLREVAYELAPPSRRRELHARAAAALTDPEIVGDAVDWRIVAGHRERAGQVGAALDAFRAAADDAQHRGELAEARALLERAIELVAGLPESAERWRREIGLRLRRGFLAVSAEGNNSLDALHDYERCLEIALADPASDEMFGTLIALWARAVIRGELARAEQVTQMMQAGLVEHPAYAPENQASFGVVRWYGGDFVAARDLLEQAVAGLRGHASDRHYEGTWFIPTDAVASTHVFLALARFVRDDGAGADEQIAAALARCRDLPFPQGPYTAASVLAYRVFIDVERDDLAAARRAVEGIAEIADRHGFDIWAVAAALQSAAVEGLADLAAEAPPEVLVQRDQVLDGMVATWQMLGIAVFVPFYLAVSSRLRAGTGDLAGAAARIDEALAVAGTTGMHFYDAELLRLRALWQVPAATGGVVDLRPGGPRRAAVDLARSQGATVFERRAATGPATPRPG